ncbi:cation diffusion facilitator family transporter [Cesiribacter andamanensis]|uniref:cation diffusion facilitator family transporter n=1 Tax=Cesiribacter andamanensis TaxID=649507 RepID=UPI000590A1F5|nr:cation diffusion facilitator family transporter [Cesiribacter andamanensis]
MLQDKKKYQGLALLIGALLMLVKFAGWWITGSNAILSDALESIVNVAASGFALYSIGYAARPQDLDHPYGHGKIEFLSAGLEGALIAIAGLAAMGKGVYNLFHPQPVSALGLGIGLTLFTGGVNWALAHMLLKKGRSLNSISMQADGRHLMTDVVTSGGLVLGLGLIYLTGQVWIDNVVAIVFGGIIILSGYRLLRDFVGGILDEADLSLVERVIVLLNRHRSKNWMDVHHLRIQRFGAGIHLDFHFTMPYYFTLEEAHREIDEVTRLVQQNLPHEAEFSIHGDPCLPPHSCGICLKDDCPVRRQPLQRRIEWTMSNAYQNEKHSLQTPD